jgi:hypothetical protein
VLTAGRGRTLDEAAGVGGDVVGDVAPAADEPAVVLQGRIEIVAPMPFREAIEGVEAAGQRMVGPLGAVVPLAEAAGGVAGVAEDLGERPLRGVHPLLAERDAADAAARMIAAGEQLGPGGGADRLHAEPLEDRAVAGERVDRGRGEVRVADERVVAPAGVVGDDDEHVWPRRRGGRDGGAEPAGGHGRDQAEVSGSSVHGTRENTGNEGRQHLGRRRSGGPGRAPL